jgi:hypothetical protein
LNRGDENSFGIGPFNSFFHIRKLITHGSDAEFGQILREILDKAMAHTRSGSMRKHQQRHSVLRL